MTAKEACMQGALTCWRAEGGDNQGQRRRTKEAPTAWRAPREGQVRKTKIKRAREGHSRTGERRWTEHSGTAEESEGEYPPPGEHRRKDKSETEKRASEGHSPTGEHRLRNRGGTAKECERESLTL
jgi:hypothetical protein